MRSALRGYPELPASVLITTDAVGGVWRYAVEMSRGLAARGWRVVLAVLGPAANPAQIAEVAEINGVRLVCMALPLDWLADTPSDLDRAAEALAELASTMEVALLHAPALLGRCAWPVPVVVVAHSCLTTWWEAVRGCPVAPDFAWRARAAADGFRRADAVAAPSHAFAAAVGRVHGLTGLTVVHNGRDPVHLPAVPRDRAVLTAGRLWDDAKNAALLDAVAARLSAPIRAAGAVMGPAGYPVSFDHLRLLGSLPEPAMREALARASVFASPARYEPFGLAVLEAAQAGMALVLSDIPTFRELWDGAAVFVPPDDPDAWTNALERALDAPGPLANRARARAARYSAAAMVHGTAALLAQVTARASVPA
jgi:glycosyltransferase involved in cell wall biosynthesis